MEVDSDKILKRSPDIETMVPYWNKVSAILEGKDAIKQGGTDFLPQFPNETNADYDFRLEVGKFTNIYKDVVEGLATKPFQDEISLVGGDDIPQELIDFIEDVDGCGNNLTTFAGLTFFNSINYAIDWIFIDYPTVQDPFAVTIADAKKMNLKPYWRHILGKNVLNVQTEMVGSKEIVTYFKYQEPTFGDEPLKVREFIKTLDGKIKWNLWIEKLNSVEKKTEFTLADEGFMTIDFIPVVPFATGRRDGHTFKFYPPMQDTADLQITLYQNESALEYIKILACYPMLATDGIKPKIDQTGKPQKIGVGPGRVLYGVPMENGNGGTWKYVEPNANSLEFLKKDIDKTKNDLRELGRQPLTALSTQLTTITTSIAAGKAKSAVTTWALGLKDALENALVITLKWMNKDYEPEVNVYTGFDDVLENGSDLEQLGKARERGDISLESYWEELKRRKVLSPEFNAERERKRLLDDIPADDSLDTSEEEATFNQVKKDKF